MNKAIAVAALLLAPAAGAQDVVPQAPLPGSVIPVPAPAGALPDAAVPNTLPITPNYQPTPPPIPPGVSSVPGFPGQSPVGRPALNTFTEQQVRSKLMANGYSNISGLSVDSAGTWRGAAVKGGANIAVTVDSNGMITPR